PILVIPLIRAGPADLVIHGHVPATAVEVARTGVHRDVDEIVRRIAGNLQRVGSTSAVQGRIGLMWPEEVDAEDRVQVAIRIAQVRHRARGGHRLTSTGVKVFGFDYKRVTRQNSGGETPR